MGVLSKITGLLMLSMFMLAAVQISAAPGASPGDDSWTTMTLVYTGDVGGKIEPCG